MAMTFAIAVSQTKKDYKLYASYEQSQKKYNREIVSFNEWYVWHKSISNFVIENEPELNNEPINNNISVEFGIGIDFLYSQHFSETKDYIQVYEDGNGNGVTTRPTFNFLRAFKSMPPNRGLNIPIFLKFDVGEHLHIMPTVSLPTIVTRNNIGIKSLLDTEIPFSIERPRGEEGDRGWNYGKSITIKYPYKYADAELKTTRIGGYISYSKNDNFMFGIGLFEDIRKYDIYQWELWAEYDYEYYSSKSYVYYRDYDEDNVMGNIAHGYDEEFAKKHDEIQTTNISVPIYFSIGWDKFRTKFEYVFTKGDRYCSLGLEFMLNLK